ncbi:MAG: NAD(P)-binding protein, partial [Paracoccaceae bacterium]|nr:NAD(P)-binding protein [Paracoccaceae bacterium]
MSDIKKVAIIGGGVGAITSAYAITQQPNWQDKYEITLYQLGWRLGGKGASGRNMKHAGRIEEHGLHIWAGFYENGFRLMRDCYDQLNVTGLRSPDAPLG